MLSFMMMMMMMMMSIRNINQHKRDICIKTIIIFETYTVIVIFNAKNIDIRIYKLKKYI